MKLKKKQKINILLNYEYEEILDNKKKIYFLDFKFLDKFEKKKFLAKFERKFFFDNKFLNFQEYLPVNFYDDFFCQLTTFVFLFTKEIIFKDQNFKIKKKKNEFDLKKNFEINLKNIMNEKVEKIDSFKKNFYQYILNYINKNQEYDILKKILKIQDESLENIKNLLSKEKKDKFEIQKTKELKILINIKKVKVNILKDFEILEKIKEIKKKNKILKKFFLIIENYIINIEDYIISDLIENFRLRKKKFLKAQIYQKNKPLSKITPNFLTFQNKLKIKNGFQISNYEIKLKPKTHETQIKLLEGICEQKFHFEKKQKKIFESEIGIHLIIFIHGYKGSHLDLDFLKHHIYLINPYLELYSIKTISKETEKDINFLSIKISEEIEDYIFNKNLIINKLSFIGFSLGGVLCRSCLKFLKKEYQKKLFFLLTLSSPHLGLNFNKKSLFHIGLKFYKIFQNKNSSLKQLLLEDENKIENSFLYKLSEMKNIKNFKYIIFIGSEEDKYSPVESSLFGFDINFKNNDLKIYKKMLENFFSNIKPDCFIRLNLKFGDFLEKDFDSYIGRKQHVEIVSNNHFLEFIVYHYEFLFVS